MDDVFSNKLAAETGQTLHDLSEAFQYSGDN